MKTVEFKLSLTSTQVAKVTQILDDLRWIYNTAVLICQEDFQRYLTKKLPENCEHPTQAPLGSIKVPGGKAKDFALYCPLYTPRESAKGNKTIYGYSVPIRPLAGLSLNLGLQNIKASFSGNERGITCEETILANWLIPQEVRERLIEIHSGIRTNAMLQAIKAQIRFKTGLAKKPKLKAGGSDSFSSWSVEGGAVSTPLPKDVEVTSLDSTKHNKWLAQNRKGDRLSLHTLGSTKILHFSRRWLPSWIMRSYRIIKKATGYFIQFVVVETAPRVLPKPSKEVVGLSLSTGSEGFIVDSLDRVYSFRESPARKKRLIRLLGKLERQRKQARKEKRAHDSQRMEKTKKEVAKLYEQSAARRKGWGHLRTTRIVKEFALIGVARPTSEQITKSKNSLKKTLAQPAAGAFTGYLEQKSKASGRTVLVESLSDSIDRTTSSCPSCSEGKLRKSPPLVLCNKCDYSVPVREFEAKSMVIRLSPSSLVIPKR